MILAISVVPFCKRVTHPLVNGVRLSHSAIIIRKPLICEYRMRKVGNPKPQEAQLRQLLAEVSTDYVCTLGNKLNVGLD